MSEQTAREPGSRTSAPEPSLPMAEPVPVPQKAAPTPEMAVRRLGPVRRYFAQHPRVSDVLVIVWFVIPVLITLMVMAPIGYQEERSGALGLGWLLASTLIVSTALWWRRQRPWTVLFIALACGIVSAFLSPDSGGTDLAAAFCIYAIAASRGPRHGWAAYGGAVAVFTLLTFFVLPNDFFTYDPAEAPAGVSTQDGGAGSISPSTSDLQVGVAFASALMGLIALTIGNGVHSRRQHENGLVDRMNQLSLERDQREQLAVADERTRIARELHDVVAHSLTVMITLSEGAAGVAPRDAQRAAAVMLDVAETGRSALTEMRTVVGVLRTGDADPTGPDGLRPAPTAALDDLVARFRSAGLPVTFVREGTDLPEDTALRLAVYRIAQESLTNVLRYAPRAGRIELVVGRTAQSVEVTVTNDAGPGIQPPAPGGGRGLIGMRERVAVFGGTLNAGATPGGWRVAAVLPWREAPSGRGPVAVVVPSVDAPGAVVPSAVVPAAGPAPETLCEDET